MSALRARCPDCRTLTAVAIGPEYQCHACGREFAAGLVRVPPAWEPGRDGTAAAVEELSLPWPEAAVVDEPSLEEQLATTLRVLPARPLVLGGCRWAHVGAIRALARREPLSVVWIGGDDPPPLPDGVEAVRPPASLNGLAGRLYVAIDFAAELPPTDELEPLLAGIPTPAGAGFSGLSAGDPSAETVTRLAHALGL